MKLPVILRDATAEDQPFILATFSKSARDSLQNASLHPSFVSGYYRRHLKRAFDEGFIQARVCVWESDPAQIFGWVAYSGFAGGRGDCLHYLYVKARFRGFGLGRALVESCARSDGGLCVSHYREDVSPKGLIYNPYWFSEVMHGIVPARIIGEWDADDARQSEPQARAGGHAGQESQGGREDGHGRGHVERRIAVVVAGVGGDDVAQGVGA